jgi:formylglycine-generating enzyme required for sulfatase activity
MLQSWAEARIFISHSSANNDAAVVLFDWLEREGWQNEVFLDLDPDRGIAAGQRWERKLNEAANRCEAVLFLVSRAWLGSVWCRKELNLAHRLNKRLYGVLIEDLQTSELPKDLTGEWQVVRLASGRDHVMLHGVLPVTHVPVTVTFSAEGLRRLKHGLELAGLDPKYFAWPPADDPNRPPYRGLRSLEKEDAGIFFGRDAPVVQALDKLRGLRESAPPRMLVILGASGAGKSSFMRAGLLPRLSRDDRHFRPLPVVRPERGVLLGESGLLRALEQAASAADVAIPRADLRAAIEGGAEKLRPLLRALAGQAEFPPADASEDGTEASSAARPPANGDASIPPVLILPIDQGEELFRAEGLAEGRAFLTLLHDLLGQDDPPLIALFTIRSDAYEPLQSANELEGLRQEVINLPPMPKGSYADVITGPVLRLQGTKRALVLDETLIERLLTDIEEGGGKDALALLAFTLERLYLEFGARKKLTPQDYEALKGINGSIEAAVEQAFKEADKDTTIPADRAARFALLRRGLIPWLAGIDPDTGIPRRRVARKSEIPADALPLINLLVEQRLLATDASKGTGEQTIEPVHEALLRQWPLLQSWLTEDAGLLALMEGVKRAGRDWVDNGKSGAWLIHSGARLEAAQRLAARPDLIAVLKPIDHEYLSACRSAAASIKARRRVVTSLIYTLLLGIIVGLVGWINQQFIKEQVTWYTVMRPYMYSQVRPYVLSAEAEKALKPKNTFHECATDCPEMIVIPPGHIPMGSPANEEHRYDDENPLHEITIAKPFAVSKFDVTFADWDACYAVGGCPYASDSGFGREKRPVINVSWEDAQQYVAWFARMTGRPYRLLTEAEWEYAARAGTTTAYFWGDQIGVGNANCNGGCGSQWDNRQTAPVGSFAANKFGLYEMHGNVWQWVQDCYHSSYTGAPTDGSAWLDGDCSRRLRRGGGWSYSPWILRSANRGADSPLNRSGFVGFRIARTLAQ